MLKHTKLLYFLESLKFASNKLSVLLSPFYCIVCYDLNNYCVYCENKCGNVSESNSYRLIALTTIISKLFKSVLLLRYKDFLSSSSNQFLLQERSQY